MTAHFTSPVRFACILALLSVGVQAQQQQQTAPAVPPRTAAGQASRAEIDAYAAALRASTRNDPANYVPSLDLLKEFLQGPHTTSADRAVIGVEVVNYAKGGVTQTRHCSGLLLRCDGFFLLPPACTSLAMSGGEEAVKQTVRITLSPGTPEQRSAVGYIRHYLVEGIDLAVMKAQGIHAPAARPLMPTALKPGDEVELVWTEWDTGAAHFGAVQRRKVHLGSAPGSDAEQKKLAWHAGEIPIEPSVEEVPAGAAVLGPEGMAVGILPSSVKRHDRFVSFAQLERVTNCVVAAPTTDEEFARLQKMEKGDNGDPAAQPIDPAAAAQNAQPPDPVAAPQDAAPAGGKAAHAVNDMVEIPGGPVRLPVAFLDNQRDMCAETIACLPAFKIDRYKVSNKEYYDFWMSLPKSERARKEVRAVLYPISWADTDPPFPAEIDDVPVLGVTVAGARAYAQSKGKRLATTYEWSRAAFGLLGDAVLPAWVPAYMQDRQQAWARIVVAHDQYVANMIPDVLRRVEIRNADISAAKIDRRQVTQEDTPGRHLPHTIPFLDPREEFTDACVWSQKTIHEEVARLNEKWLSPLYVLPAGSRPFDVSPFGVMDVILNGYERVTYSPEPILGINGDTGGRPTAVKVGLETLMPVSRVSRMSLWPVLPFCALDRESNGTEGSPFLLSRRLVASSSRVRPGLREFTPSDAEAYVEYRSRIHEEMAMAAPVDRLRVEFIGTDLQENDQWGEATIEQDLKRKAPVAGKLGQSLSLAQGIGGLGTLRLGHAENADRDNAISVGRPSDFAWQKRYPLGTAIEVIHPARPILYRQGIAWPGVPPESVADPFRYTIPLNLLEEIQLGGAPGVMARRDESIVVFVGEYFDESWFYPVWAGVSPFFHREMGRDWAKDRPIHVGDWPELGAPLTQPADIYLVPNGFRCAR